MKELPADGSLEKLREDNCENTCRQNIDEPEIEKRTVYKWGFLHVLKFSFAFIGLGRELFHLSTSDLPIREKQKSRFYLHWDFRL